MNAPKVSVCIPAYRQPDLLRRALDSLSVQEFTDFEVIITDDSPDDAVETLAKTYAFAGGLHYRHNRPALGSPQNWNAAVALARGSYIKILHHDDWLANAQALSRLVLLLDQHPEADFAFGGSWIEDFFSGKKLKTYQASPAQLAVLRRQPETLLTGNLVGAPSATLYRRSAETAYDPRLKWLVDLDFYVAVLRKNPRFASTPDWVAGIGHLPSRVTVEVLQDKNLLLFEYFYFAEKWNLDLSQPPFYDFFGRLFARLRVRSAQEIRQAGYQGPLPPVVQRWLRLRGWFTLKNKWKYWPLSIKNRLLGRT